MTIAEIRRINLQYIVATRCNKDAPLKDLAERMGWQHQYASITAGRKAKKNLGEKIARKIEDEFELPRGWLDAVHDFSSEKPEKWRRNIIDTLVQYRVDKPVMEQIPEIHYKKVADWLADDASAGDDMARFPVFSIITLGPRSFVMREYISNMPPAVPGDYYYVDPDVPPASGTDCVFIINGFGVAGTYEESPTGERLTFKKPGEPSIPLNDATYAGRIVFLLKAIPTQITLR